MTFPSGFHSSPDKYCCLLEWPGEAQSSFKDIHLLITFFSLWTGCSFQIVILVKTSIHFLRQLFEGQLRKYEELIGKFHFLVILSKSASRKGEVVIICSTMQVLFWRNFTFPYEEKFFRSHQRQFLLVCEWQFFLVLHCTIIHERWLPGNMVICLGWDWGRSLTYESV